MQCHHFLYHIPLRYISQVNRLMSNAKLLMETLNERQKDIDRLEENRGEMMTLIQSLQEESCNTLKVTCIKCHKSDKVTVLWAALATPIVAAYLLTLDLFDRNVMVLNFWCKRGQPTFKPGGHCMTQNICAIERLPVSDSYVYDRKVFMWMSHRFSVWLCTFKPFLILCCRRMLCYRALVM